MITVVTMNPKDGVGLFKEFHRTARKIHDKSLVDSSLEFVNFAEEDRRDRQHRLDSASGCDETCGLCGGGRICWFHVGRSVAWPRRIAR